MRVRAFLATFVALLAIPAFSTGPDTGQDSERCPYCRLPVKSDDASLDYRVTMIRGGKTAAYRCVLCALADAKSMKGDLVIQAASEKKGEPVKISRASGKWSLDPGTAVFAYAEGSHMQCQGRYRALRSPEAFAVYAKENAKYSFPSKPLTLKELLAVVDR